MKSNSEIRKAVKTIFGSTNAYVTRNGEIHVRAGMPNSCKYGWYLFGFTGSDQTEEKIWYPDGSLASKAV